MKENQFKEITKWHDETFPNATASSKIAHLEQEVVELSFELLKRDDDKIQMEFADCFLLLFGAAAKYGMSYEDISVAIEIKMEINKKRKWGTPDANGVVNHIKELK